MLTIVHLVSLQGRCRAMLFSAFGFLIASSNMPAQQIFPQLEICYQEDTSLVFRGISALDDHVVWASSNQGSVVKTEDGGVNWTILKIPGAEQIQFRDIHVFNTNTAVIMGAGWPTRMYKTTDAGTNWRLVYENNDSAVFLDAFDFWPDGSGLCFGDPINGKFFMLKTIDGGSSWFEIPGPEAAEGEAGFAASGTSLICFGINDDAALFASGGTDSHIFISPNRGISWVSQPSGFIAGRPSRGIFGIAKGEERLLFVGGDYLNPQLDSLTVGAIFFEMDDIKGSMGFGLPYQSAAVILSDSIAISVGTPGCHISFDGGFYW